MFPGKPWVAVDSYCLVTIFYVDEDDYSQLQWAKRYRVFCVDKVLKHIAAPKTR